MSDKKKAIIALLVGLAIFFLVKVVLADTDVSCKAYLKTPGKYFGQIVAGVNAAPREPVWERSLDDLWFITLNQCRLDDSKNLSDIVAFNRAVTENIYAPEDGYGCIIYTENGESFLDKALTKKEKQDAAIIKEQATKEKLDNLILWAKILDWMKVIEKTESLELKMYVLESMKVFTAKERKVDRKDLELWLVKIESIYTEFTGTNI